MRLIDADGLKARLMARYTAHNLDDTRDMAARAAIMSCVEAVNRSKTITLNKLLNNVGTASWIDNADSYICSQCGYECNNPNKELCGAAVCPRCLATMELENRRKWTNKPLTLEELREMDGETIK